MRPALHTAWHRALSTLPALFALIAAMMPTGMSPGQAQDGKDIAATLVRLQEGSSAPVPVGRLWLSFNRVRLEIAGLADGYFIIDGAAPSATFIRPAAGIYMDARRSSRLTELFVPVDPADPCRQWQAMAGLAGEPDHGSWRCERIGEETVRGRAAVAFRATASSELQLLGWVDPALGLPLQIKLGDGTMFAVDAIREQPQSAEMMQIPATFHKFNPEALIERIKQSDVWVDAR